VQTETETRQEATGHHKEDTGRRREAKAEAANPTGDQKAETDLEEQGQTAETDKTETVRE
jgi:hypothetical protein